MNLGSFPECQLPLTPTILFSGICVMSLSLETTPIVLKGAPLSNECEGVRWRSALPLPAAGLLKALYWMRLNESTNQVRDVSTHYKDH